MVAMQEIEPVSSVIASIYDAALDPSLWKSALEKSAIFVGGESGRYWLDVAEVGPKSRHFRRKDFWQKLLSAEPPARVQPFRKIGATIIGNVFIHRNAPSPEVTLETNLSKHPIPLWSGTATKKCVACFAVYTPCHDDASIEQSRQRLKLILPHILRAVEICKAIGTNAAAVAALADTLDGLEASIFLVNALGRTVHTNSNGNGVSISLNHAIAADHGAQRSQHASHAFSIEVDTVKHRGDDSEVVGGLIVHQTTPRTDSAVDQISHHYRLARRERQILQAMVDGQGLTEIARKLAIAHSTAKTYLHRLFKKTGTGCPTDLVKLCAAFRSPFSG